ncbi:MAG: nucleotidyltransferase family protein [Acidobacteria bacterium]|nr:nucleotidyltransferase family protein [Acidobacteriota bacterium]
MTHHHLVDQWLSGYRVPVDEAAASWLASQRLVGLIPGLLTARPDLIRSAVGQHLQATVWLDALNAICQKKDVRLLAFKGLGMALQPQIYTAAVHRPLGDLDLWVDGDLEAAIQAAEACGYRQLYPHQVITDYTYDHGYAVPLVHPHAGMLELHHRLWRDIPLELERDMKANTRLVGPLHVIEPVHLALASIVHYTQSGRLFWGWLLESVLLVRSLPETEQTRLVHMSRKYGLQSFVAFVLRLACETWPCAFEPIESLAEACWNACSRLEQWAVQRAIHKPSYANRMIMIQVRRFQRGTGRSACSPLRLMWPPPGAVMLELRLEYSPTFWDRLKLMKKRVGQLVTSI